jgi:hypothetical protein
MKTEIRIINNSCSVIVTPETDFEAKVLALFDSQIEARLLNNGALHISEAPGAVINSEYASYVPVGAPDDVLSIEPNPFNPIADRAVAKLDDLIAAGQPHSDAE